MYFDFTIYVEGAFMYFISFHPHNPKKAGAMVLCPFGQIKEKNCVLMSYSRFAASDRQQEPGFEYQGLTADLRLSV